MTHTPTNSILYNTMSLTFSYTRSPIIFIMKCVPSLTPYTWYYPTQKERHCNIKLKTTFVLNSIITYNTDR